MKHIESWVLSIEWWKLSNSQKKLQLMSFCCLWQLWRVWGIQAYRECLLIETMLAYEWEVKDPMFGTYNELHGGGECGTDWCQANSHSSFYTRPARPAKCHRVCLDWFHSMVQSQSIINIGNGGTGLVKMFSLIPLWFHFVCQGVFYCGVHHIWKGSNFMVVLWLYL